MYEKNLSVLMWPGRAWEYFKGRRLEITSGKEFVSSMNRKKERKEHHRDSSWLRNVTVHSRDQPAVPPTSMSLMIWIQSSKQFFWHKQATKYSLRTKNSFHLKNHFLCSFTRRNFSFVKFFSGECSNSVTSPFLILILLSFLPHLQLLPPLKSWTSQSHP